MRLAMGALSGIKTATFSRIVEHRDASDSEKEIKEINSGMYVFSSKELAETIELLSNDNNQGEYYLTDLIEIMISKGYSVGNI
jgi:bifunctional UDP-N-acetylglucosamine pyrophosphorylase/glucosamine-1-phosphate N-acetyltransferase